MMKNRGFTLSELLITVVIMASLAAIAMPLYTKTIKRSRAGDALNVMSAISAKQEAYFVSKGKYATSFSELAAPVEGLSGDKEQAVVVGNFEYVMKGLCVTASRVVDGYQLSKNFVTQQEGCKNLDKTKACSLLENLIPVADASGCEYVPPTTGDINDIPPELDPCAANPRLCCAGTWYNGACHSCPTGTIWDNTKKTCVCNATCSDGSTIDPETCSCSCNKTCPEGSGQVQDDYCACRCPEEKPEWDTSAQRCVNKCSEPKTRWSGTECVCPTDKPLEISGGCYSCDAPRIMTSAGSCQCPPDFPFFWNTSNACTKCTEDNVETHKAACEIGGPDSDTGPAGTFNASKCMCVCPDGSALTSVGGSCKCSGSTPFYHDEDVSGVQGGICKSCDVGYEMTVSHPTNNICCRPNQVTLDGKTCRYVLSPKTITVQAKLSVDTTTCVPSYSSVIYYDSGSLETRSTKTYHRRCCAWCDWAWRSNKQYYTGCDAFPTGNWIGGKVITGITDPCPPGTEKELCEKNCKADGTPCNFKCVKSRNIPPTPTYNCYTEGDCRDGWSYNTIATCPSYMKGTVELLTCSY